MSQTIPYVSGSVNPISGCVRYSRGCDNCYAHTWAQRFRGGDFSLKYFPAKLDIIRNKKSGLWFIGSMTDLFQDGIDEQFVHNVFTAMQDSKAKFLVLTKRAANMARYFQGCQSPENVGIGVTAEGQAEWNKRIPILLSIKASMRWVSVEPMLEHVKPDGLEYIDWLIAGPETGAKKREFKSSWIDVLTYNAGLCRKPFFDKRDGYLREWPKEWQP